MLSDSSLQAKCLFLNAMSEFATFEETSLNSGVYNVVCTFPLGIPYAASASPIDLIYYPNALDQEQKLFSVRNGVTLTSTFFVPLEFGPEHDCSFYGGCEYIIYGFAVSGSLINDPDNNYVTVCDTLRCELDIAKSDELKAVCILPSLEDLNTGSDVTCGVDVFYAGTKALTLKDAEYTVAATSTLTSFTPLFGPDDADTEITFTGTFVTGTPTVTIDGADCPVDSNDSTTIVCTASGEQTDTSGVRLTIYIDGMGLVGDYNS